jgi:monovalent cation:H+ antiporter-2, CPA2 family
VREARAMQPDLYIIARAENARQVEELRRAGASDVVQPEFEAGVEVLRHTLRRYGITEPQLGTLAEERRSGFYHAVAASGAE